MSAFLTLSGNSGRGRNGAVMQASGAIRRIIFGFAVLGVPSHTIARAETIIFNCTFGDQSRWRLEINDRAETVTRKVVGASGIPSLTRNSPAKFSGHRLRWKESAGTLSVEFSLNLHSGILVLKNIDSRGGVFGGQIEGCERESRTLANFTGSHVR